MQGVWGNISITSHLCIFTSTATSSTTTRTGTAASTTHKSVLLSILSASVACASSKLFIFSLPTDFISYTHRYTSVSTLGLTNPNPNPPVNCSSSHYQQTSWATHIDTHLYLHGAPEKPLVSTASLSVFHNRTQQCSVSVETMLWQQTDGQLRLVD